MDKNLSPNGQTVAGSYYGEDSALKWTDCCRTHFMLLPETYGHNKELSVAHLIQKEMKYLRHCQGRQITGLRVCFLSLFF